MDNLDALRRALAMRGAAGGGGSPKADGYLSGLGESIEGYDRARRDHLRGAADRNYMPDVIDDHPNVDVSKAYDIGTNYAEGWGAEGQRIADRAYGQSGPAIRALGNVMARRYELRHADRNSEPEADSPLLNMRPQRR
jgi:hypothetical protein